MAFAESRKFIVLIVIASFSIFAFLAIKPFRSAAQETVKIAENPASEGRTITPAGTLLIDAATNQKAVASLPVDFVRSPDSLGADGKGRYLLAINSGFGIQFSGNTNRGQQSVSVIDLNAQPEPKIIQNVYFPSPQSANVGMRFDSNVSPDGSFRLFVSGGFENKIWLFKFAPNEMKPISPAPEDITKKIEAPFIDVSAFATRAPSPNYNSNLAPVYPTGIALSPDGNTLFSANNLGDTLGIISDLRDERRLTRISLSRHNSTQLLYPYEVEITPAKDGKNVSKAYVSLWGDASIAVVELQNGNRLKHIAVERHPTAMILNRDKSRLFVVNSNADSVSVIDTKSDKIVERINLKLSESENIGASPEGLALSDDEKTLYVANAHANAIAVVSLKSEVLSMKSEDDEESEDKEKEERKERKEKTEKIIKTKSKKEPEDEEKESSDSTIENQNSKLLGFIPTGQYASAVAVVGNRLFAGNGKGTGVENSSVIVNNSGRVPNAPNEAFPPKNNNQGGQYSASIVSGNISLIDVPSEQKLFDYTQSVMRNNGLLGERKTKLFAGASPFKHIIYIIRENRTYDQVFGDLEKSGDGSKADGDAKLAIFGAGDAAKSPSGKSQNITPNVRALALRFGLLDRFFVNAEASPDGHNWSTAAFSNDYIDKAFRWAYSGRGRTYDYEGFNRLPSYSPPANQPPVALPPVFDLPATENDIANYMKKYVPYLNGGRDIGEPETLYLWDAAQRAGLSYRNYGEYIATVSAEDLKEVNEQKPKKYPDISPTVTAFATKKSLENHFSATHRNFDMQTPDVLTTDSYRVYKESNGTVSPEITPDNSDARFRGTSRFGDWQKEFRGYVADLNAGKPDKLPNLSIVRFSNDHTAGLRAGTPTPQFYVAENDYAIGKVIEEISNSPYWKDTAIFIVEDDAQAGPDHVDAHRSPAFVISAYNRKGALIHDFHNTVSLIRTMELLLNLRPMNLLDSTATPINIFTDTPDLTPFKVEMPEVALDNLMPPRNPSAEMRKYMNLTAEQDLEHQDMANPEELNAIIWYSVTGNKQKIPEVAAIPAYELMTVGLMKEDDEEEEREQFDWRDLFPQTRKSGLKNIKVDADDGE
jgi:YVTN family beta-propeller protein